MENNTVLISAAGQPGLAGTQQWDGSTGWQAPQGTNGRHGRDATFPTPGGMGGDIHVMLGFDPSRPGLIQVEGGAHRTGSRWEVGGDEGLLLDVRGGDGGAGGLGENGQMGGNGYNGRDANQLREAEDGSPGMNGGDGGRGTSGANGGQGGSANVTVNEEDLDTLIGLQWDIRGGRGGLPGQHGTPGDGGNGGDGGASYFWTESIPTQYRYADGGYSHTEYHTRFHSRPGGQGGPGGQAGRHNNEQLYAGHNGPPGFAQIIVFAPDGRRTVYPSRYMLEVVDFKVADENGDGINEPGEHLIVSDIVIKNTGMMPSPRLSKLQVLIRGTKWLEPVPEPLQLPVEIPPGHSVQVPGRLRAFIKNETASRDPGTLLQARDTVSLRAYSMRLQRDVPEFKGGVDITCQYPFLMTTPKYLDCVAKGDTVRFSWTIQNISQKSQGRSGSLYREAGTHLSDPRGMFDFKRAPPETPHDIMDVIEVLQPGETVPVTVDFQVSELVNEFTTGNMIVNLMLSDPHTKSMRQVVSFDLRIQISPSYRLNPAARFLLVINGSSPNAFVVQIIDFIQRGLGLAVDVFNLSLTGSFQAADTRNQVLLSYAGKTVLILGNTMNYFQRGQRDPWEMLDVAQTFALARQGTAFLVISPSNTQSLKGFVHLLAAGGVASEGFLNPGDPTSGADPGGNVAAAGSQSHQAAAAAVTNIKDLLAKLTSGSPASGSSPINSNLHDGNTTTTLAPPLRLQVKKRALRKLSKTLTSTAKTAQQKLANTFPLRRFLVGPSCLSEPDTAGPGAKTASLTVTEGLPHRAKFLASLQPLSSVRGGGGGGNDNAAMLSEYTAALLTHSIPFPDQCRIFWELSAAGTAAASVTGGKLISFSSPSSSPSSSSSSSASSSILSWCISSQLASELAFFHSSGSGVSGRPLLPQLPLLHTFVSSAPAPGSSSAAAGPTVDGPGLAAFAASLARVLGVISGAVSPLSFSQRVGGNLTSAGKRRKKMQKLVGGAEVSGSLVKVLVAADKGSAPSKTASKEQGGLVLKDKPVAEQVKDVERGVKGKLVDIKKRNPGMDCIARAHELACILLGEAVSKVGSGGSNGSPARYWDVLNDPETRAGHAKMVRVLTREEYVQLKQRYAERSVRVKEDAEFSFARLKGMVSKGAQSAARGDGISTVSPRTPAPVLPAAVSDKNALMIGVSVSPVVQELSPVSMAIR